MDWKTMEEKYDAVTLDKLKKLLSEMDKHDTIRQSVGLKPVRAECDVFSSKLGGVPYFPLDMEYPVVREGELAGKPLKFLAQLNFGILPHIDGFPESGILQFFTGSDGDDVVGIDFDDYLKQNGFRVIFHRELISDTDNLYKAENMPIFGDEYMFPFTGEFLLEASSVESNRVNMVSWEFEKVAVESYNKIFNREITSVFGNEYKNLPGLRTEDEKLYEALCDATYTGTGTRIGGFPFFTQDDPRPYREEYKRCDTLLFQLDSDGDDEIIWGDCGVGNFFINAADLKNLDFSHVLYTWDCC